MSVGAVNKQTGERIPTAGMPAVDSVLSGTSTNPVQNKVVKAALDEKANTDMVAADFNAGTSYTAGNYCVQDGKLYKFKNNHSGAWSSADVDEVKIAGELSSLKSGLTDLSDHVDGDATTYDFADVITIEDAIPANLADCNVKIEPVQDLHGYDKPWVGGAGKNKCAGTYTTTTNGGVTFTAQSDGTVRATDTSTGYAYVNSSEFTIKAGTYTFSGAPSGNTKYVLAIYSGATLVSQISNGTETDVTFESDTNIVVRCVVNGADVATGVTYKPMLRLSTESDSTFAPYTNFCPISGHTEASVQRDGKNQLVNAFEQGAILGSVGSSYSDCKVSMPTRIRTVDLIKLDKTKNYTFSIKNGFNYVVQFFDDDKKLYIGQGSNTWTETALTITNVPYVAIAIKKSTDGNIIPSEYVDAECQMEYGSTATPYEPYAGQQYTLALGDTIYGGTVDFNSGVMTVTHGIVDMGQYNYSITDIDNQYFTTIRNRYKAPASLSDKPNWMCDSYDVGLPTYTNSHPLSNYTIGCFGDFPQNNIVFVRDPRCSSTAEMKTALNGVYLCYELATPTTIQLTPQQIQLLKGQNTLTASTGQISVTANGVSGAIGAVQEQANDHEERIEAVESGLIKHYILTKASFNWDSAEKCFITGINFDTTIPNYHNLVGIVVNAANGMSIMGAYYNSKSHILRIAGWVSSSGVTIDDAYDFTCCVFYT